MNANDPKTYFPNRLLKLIALFLLLAAATNCSSDSDSGDIAGALADRLTDAMNFDSGTVKEGSPPDASDSADAPQLDKVNGDDMRLGAPLLFSLLSDYAGQDEVEAAIIYVDGATKYFVVEAALFKGLMEIFGQLAVDEELRGESFNLRFALQTAAGLVGAYKTLDLDVVDQPAQESGQEIDAISMPDTVPQAGVPQGNSGENYPQILEVAGDEQVTPGGVFHVILHTDFTQPDRIAGAILTVPGADEHFQLEGEALPDGLLVYGQMSEDLKPGDGLVFKWALITKDDEVGLYRSWEVEVVAKHSETDGDYNPDGDHESTAVNLRWQHINDFDCHLGCVPGDNSCLADEQPARQVKVTPYMITEKEITQGQFHILMARDENNTPVCPDCPVDFVDHGEAETFCSYVGGRLPTEAEWECAARLNYVSTYICGEDSNCLGDAAWYADNSEGAAHPVGGKNPNDAMLYDMTGNVREWVADCYHETYEGAPGTTLEWADEACAGSAMETLYVSRGGCFEADEIAARLSQRFADPISTKDAHLGFRCAMDLSFTDGDVDVEVEMDVDGVDVSDGDGSDGDDVSDGDLIDSDIVDGDVDNTPTCDTPFFIDLEGQFTPKGTVIIDPVTGACSGVPDEYEGGAALFDCMPDGGSVIMAYPGWTFNATTTGTITEGGVWVNISTAQHAEAAGNVTVTLTYTGGYVYIIEAQFECLLPRLRVSSVIAD